MRSLAQEIRWCVETAARRTARWREPATDRVVQPSLGQPSSGTPSSWNNRPWCWWLPDRGMFLKLFGMNEAALLCLSWRAQGFFDGAQRVGNGACPWVRQTYLTPISVQVHGPFKAGRIGCLYDLTVLLLICTSYFIVDIVRMLWTPPGFEIRHRRLGPSFESSCLEVSRSAARPIAQSRNRLSTPRHGAWKRRKHGRANFQGVGVRNPPSLQPVVGVDKPQYESSTGFAWRSAPVTRTLPRSKCNRAGRRARVSPSAMYCSRRVFNLVRSP